LIDALIIGSGAGGAACAWGLARRGISVRVLEAGARFDPARDYSLQTADWETAGFPTPPGSTWPIELISDQPLDPAFAHLRSWSHLQGNLGDNARRDLGEILHVRGVGGTTLHFTGEAHRLHPDAMRMRSRFGVGADWPIDYAAIEPYYAEAEELIGAAGENGDPVRWRSRAYPLPAHAPSHASQRLIAATQGSFRWRANPLGVLSAPYDGRPGCNYCNNCNRGCPRGDKASADVTFLRRALATGKCELEAGAEVLRLEAGEDDRVREVIYADGQGRRQSLAARVIVLAGGAVQSPRLLLLSEGKHARGGLANESGQVGRNFLETVFHAAAALHSENLGTWRGLPSDVVCWDYNAPDGIPGVVGGCRLVPFTASMDLVGPIAYATRVVGGWGRDHAEHVQRAFGHALALGGFAECLPHPAAFVDLHPWKRDQHGQAIARVHAHLDAQANAREDFIARRIAEIFGLMGAEKIFERFGTYDRVNASHIFGTCRMGKNAEESVVNADCLSHRWRNLYVADASVFPSSGGGEAPSLTIEALALRAAAHIAGRLSARDL